MAEVRNTLLVVARSIFAAAGFAIAGQSFGQSSAMLISSGATQRGDAATDGSSCGGDPLTQNANPNVLTIGSIACSLSGSTTDNFYARNFALAAPAIVKCVDFGIERNPGVHATMVRVRMYSQPNAGTPVTASMSLIPGSEIFVGVPGKTTLSFFNATYPGNGIAVPAGNLVVELFTACRQTSCNPPGDGEGIWIGSNSSGQTAPWYIKAPACGVTDFVDVAVLGFPNVHFVMQLGMGSVACDVMLPPCPADVSGGGDGPPDGLVNVNDLLAVINSWGEDGNPDGPRPRGDCAPPPIGDCIVNVNDLLAVINSWGACSCQPAGCCLPNGLCQTLCLAACADAGGVWLGAGSSCANVACEPFSNDECAGAIRVFNGATAISNVGATTSQGIPGGMCIFGGPSNIRKDVWYRFVAVCTGQLIVDLCDTTGAVTDTTLQVYSGTCGNLMEVACDDDACAGNTAAGDRSRVTFFADFNTEYRIRVGVWGNNAPGPMVLRVTNACIGVPAQGSAEAPPVVIGSTSPRTVSGIYGHPDNPPACDGVVPGSGL